MQKTQNNPRKGADVRRQVMRLWLSALKVSSDAS